MKQIGQVEPDPSDVRPEPENPEEPEPPKKGNKKIMNLVANLTVI